jgi:hypothetical protein
MTDQEIAARGWSVAIYRAVQLAGGPTKVGDAMGLAAITPMRWYQNGSIKAKYLSGLCALGGNRITPQEILDDLAQRVAA